MGQTVSTQKTRREQLVVRRKQRAGVVQDDDPTRFERAERPHAVVDAVERRENVEPTERGVARPELVERLVW
jgi:hypothetical protein